MRVVGGVVRIDVRSVEVLIVDGLSVVVEVVKKVVATVVVRGRCVLVAVVVDSRDHGLVVSNQVYVGYLRRVADIHQALGVVERVGLSV